MAVERAEVPAQPEEQPAAPPAVARPSPRGRALALRVLRAAVSLLLVAWLLREVSWQEVLRSLAGMSLPIVAVGASVYYLGVLLSCWKWQITLRLEGIALPLRRLLGWYMIGAFAGNFLPTDIGGDLGRGIYAGRHTGRPLAVARSILVERLTGLAVMALLALVGLAVMLGQPWPALVGLAGLVGAALLGPRLAAPLLRRAPRRVRALAEDLAGVVAAYRQQPDAVAQIWALSLAFQLLACFGPWLNLRAVGAELPVLPVVLVSAMAGVLGVLPIAINGWGVRESVFVTLLAPLGAAPGDILAGVLLGRALVLALSLVGAAPLLLERK